MKHLWVVALLVALGAQAQTPLCTSSNPCPTPALKTDVVTRPNYIPVTQWVGASDIDALLALTYGWTSPEQYGVACNGVTDDGPALQGAIIAASASLSGVLVPCPMHIASAVGAVGVPVWIVGQGSMTFVSGGSATFNDPIAYGSSLNTITQSGGTASFAAGVATGYFATTTTPGAITVTNGNGLSLSGGVLAMSGSPTFTGSGTFNGGTLNVTGAATINASGGTFTGSVIAGSGYFDSAAAGTPAQICAVTANSCYIGKSGAPVTVNGNLVTPGVPSSAIILSDFNTPVYGYSLGCSVPNQPSTAACVGAFTYNFNSHSDTIVTPSNSPQRWIAEEVTSTDNPPQRSLRTNINAAGWSPWTYYMTAPQPINNIGSSLATTGGTLSTLTSGVGVAAMSFYSNNLPATYAITPYDIYTAGSATCASLASSGAMTVNAGNCTISLTNASGGTYLAILSAGEMYLNSGTATAWGMSIMNAGTALGWIWASCPPSGPTLCGLSNSYIFTTTSASTLSVSYQSSNTSSALNDHVAQVSTVTVIRLY